ncbi:hypothetical protein [Actinomadura gamaensis]|uniref:Uncharacterized protein n=1 Tax=Actinomadura gamaensis TaxID=1763541 RepID=A0ABV9TY36_9ACTN
MNETVAVPGTAPAERRISYRSPWPWVRELVWALVIVGWALGGHVSLPWLAGVLLSVGAALVGAALSLRGYTLSAAGILCHKNDLFIPWSNVAEVSVRTVGSAEHVVVRLVEPDQLNDVRPRMAAFAARRNVEKYGGAFAPRVRWLGVPAEEFVAEAERLRAAYQPGRLVQRKPSPLQRVAGAGVMIGLVLLLFSVATGQTPRQHAHAHASTGQRTGKLEFRYQAKGGAGYMDQTLAIANRGGDPVAPKLAFVAQDEGGHDLPGVNVRTALGSDGGLVVVPPRSLAYDVLAFSGPSAGSVRKVKVVVLDTVPVSAPMLPSEGLRAEPLDARGRLVRPGAPFAKVRVSSRSTSQLAALDTGDFRVVCIMWGPDSATVPQQMLDRVAITDVATMDRGAPAEVDVTGAARRRTGMCGSVVAYYSRA